MDWVLIGGCAIAAWAMLSVLGGERQRLINELPPPPPPAEPTPTPPVAAAAPRAKH